jgi:hypothetical protein
MTAQWIIAVLLAFIAGLLCTRSDSNWLPSAAAQQPPLAGARGVYAFTGQLEANRHGLFMLDIEQGTIWCYELDSGAGSRKLRLVAGRSWIYDRYLKNFNCAMPDWRMVEQLVAQERSQTEARSAAASILEGEKDAEKRDSKPDQRD